MKFNIMSIIFFLEDSDTCYCTEQKIFESMQLNVSYILAYICVIIRHFRLTQ